LGLAVILGAPTFAQLLQDGATSRLSRGAMKNKEMQPLLLADRHSSPLSVEEVPEPSLKIHIRLRDYARVPKRTLARAIRKATQILRSAGVEIQWIPCQLSAEGLLGNGNAKRA
jgi:hypothetical protein